MGNLNAAMVLYDAAIVLKEKGDYKAAKSKLQQALNKMATSQGYQKSSNQGTIVALTYYQLGLASELDRDFLTAKDSYAKCLRIKPSYTPASVRLVNILAKYGHIELAKAKAQEAVRNNPKDPRSHLLLSLLSQKKGDTELARKQEAEISRLLSVEAQIIPKNNARQKNVIRMVDYLNKSKPQPKPVKPVEVKPTNKPVVTTVKPHDEVNEDDAIEENPADLKADPEPNAKLPQAEGSDATENKSPVAPVDNKAASSNEPENSAVPSKETVKKENSNQGEIKTPGSK